MKLRPELLNVVCNMDILSHSEGKRKRDRRKGERERERERKRERKGKNNKWKSGGGRGGNKKCVFSFGTLAGDSCCAAFPRD